ncbi:MAG: asparaginase domain-containing protein [Candidatus Peregrinibacteria bacterium]
MKPNITLLLTGGTMDGIISPGDEAKAKKGSITKEYLDSMYLYFSYDAKRICKKDSRKLTDEDRRDILQAVQKAKSDKILIIHGTFTLEKTSRFLKKHQKTFPGKAVVLTGSMIPLEKYAPGDAPFNLGFAIAALLHAKPGVYVAMNGRTFNADNVRKNIGKGRFETQKPS